MDASDPPEVQLLARSDGPRGEVVLRRRRGDRGQVDELIVNGTFAMDSLETHTEQVLGELAVEAVRDVSAPARILVGGLGLGFTARELLEAADLEALAVLVDVVEIEGCLVDWARQGLTTTLARVAADPRIRLHTADVLSVLAGRRADPHGPWDAIVLDVDNGPDFLIHAGNDLLYAETGLEAAYAQLTRGGMLAIWCQGPSEPLWDRLCRVGPNLGVHEYSVLRGQRELTYVIYTLTR